MHGHLNVKFKLVVFLPSLISTRNYRIKKFSFADMRVKVYIK